MTDRKTSAEFLTAFATGWPENEPDLVILSLTTASGMRDFALTREQALVVAKTLNDTVTRGQKVSKAKK